MEKVALFFPSRNRMPPIHVLPPFFFFPFFFPARVMLKRPFDDVGFRDGGFSFSFLSPFAGTGIAGPFRRGIRLVREIAAGFFFFFPPRDFRERGLGGVGWGWREKPFPFFLFCRGLGMVSRKRSQRGQAEKEAFFVFLGLGSPFLFSSSPPFFPPPRVAGGGLITPPSTANQTAGGSGLFSPPLSPSPLELFPRDAENEIMFHCPGSSLSLLFSPPLPRVPLHLETAPNTSVGVAEGGGRSSWMPCVSPFFLSSGQHHCLSHRRSPP